MKLQPGYLCTGPYLTTRGRVTGRDHTIEIWFAVDGPTVYMLSGGGRRSDWVRNLLAQPDVVVRIRDREWGGVARVVTDADERQAAAQLVFSKYEPGYGGDLTSWRESALPVAVVLTMVPSGEASPGN